MWLTQRTKWFHGGIGISYRSSLKLSIKQYQNIQHNGHNCTTADLRWAGHRFWHIQ